MRNLTIKRTKSAVAGLAKMKVYIEDPENSELQINGVPCRKLGDLKNGEEKTFSVGDHAAKVFVITDTASRNYSNDYYPLPEGTEDVTVTGKNCYNPSAGNPFRFDGITDEAVLANRKKGNKKGMVILVVALILGFVLGLARTTLEKSQTEKAKEFSTEGMTITLTAEFKEESYEGFTQCYETKDVAVFTLKEEFTLMEGLEDYTVAEYGELVVLGNGLDDSALKTENGVTYFDYNADGSSGTEFYYFATVHKSGDAFWLIQFAVDADQAEQYRPLFFQWAASVTFE